MSKNVIIIGAGGHAKVLADIVLKSGDHLLGFLDDKKNGAIFGEYEVLGTTADMKKYTDCAMFIIGIGSAAVREKLSCEQSARWYTAIHPSASVSLGAEIGEGSAVMAGAVINADAKIGKHAIINTHTSIDHDCLIGDFCHVSPGAVLCGTVSVGKRTHIGAGAVIRNNISITSDVTVGCGAAVVKNIDLAGTYVGVPARLI